MWPNRILCRRYRLYRGYQQPQRHLSRCTHPADPVDDAGQTHTPNQRASLHTLIQALKIGGLAKIANNLRQLESDDIAVVTIPTTAHREDEGTVIVDLDAEAMPALKGALAGNDLPDFFRYLVSLGY